MPLAHGTRFGPYEILSPLGAGGMGEVYRARDTRLGREIAVKVLPPGAASSEERRRRFEREAQLISQLAHPHICALYDVGTEGSVAYLVMELLEGETLSDRLYKGSLPLEDVVRIGTEICAALDAAHARGIVHRDLKPGNVMLTDSGVKLLDFGLAKALEPDVVRAELSTVTHGTTVTGAVLGTLQYMAPEQLEGRTVDARADIFALGTILYEMTTGRPAFSATSQASLISAILTSDPPSVSSLQTLAPPALSRLVRTCLAKDPARRWRSAHDVGLQLAAVTAAEPAGAAAPAVPPRPSRVPWIVAALASAAAVALLLVRPGPRPEQPPRGIRFLVPPPSGGSFFSSDVLCLAVSPDGSRFAFCAADPARRPGLWLRSISSAEVRLLPGTEGGHSPFFSPDGTSVAFFRAGALNRIAIGQPSAVPICDTKVTGGRSGTWGAHGDILFSSAPPVSDAIWRVPASGGTPTPVVKVDRSRGELGVGYPRFLPDGERFLYFLLGADGAGTLMLHEPGRAPRRVMPVESLAEPTDGHLLYVHEGALLGVRFDAKSGRVSGAPFSIFPQVRYTLGLATAAFAVSRNGTLVYQPQSDVQRVVWYDRTGREVGTLGAPGDYQYVALAPSGRRLAYARARPGLGTLDLYVMDPERGAEERVTSGRLSETTPVWSRDEKSLFYSASRDGPTHLHRLELATSRDEELLATGGYQMAGDVSPDGRTLVYVERATDRRFWTIRELPLVPRGTPRVLAHQAGTACLSPDGGAMAYLSLEASPWDVYVMPFPGPGERARVSVHGAEWLAWSPRGGELLYTSTDGHLMSVPVATRPSLVIGTPTTLFKLPGKRWTGFQVSPDGERILAIEPQVLADESPFVVVVGLESELK